MGLIKHKYHYHWAALWLLASGFILGFMRLPVMAQTNVQVEVPKTQITVRGYTSPGALVTIQNDASTTTTSTNANGYFTKSIATSSGIHLVQVSSQDVDGLATVRTSQSVSVQSQTTKFINLALSPTITIDNKAVAQGEQNTVHGYTVPNSTLVIIIDNNTYITSKSNHLGQWQQPFSTNNFYIGSHTVGALVQTSYGFSDVSLKHIFDITPAAEVSEDNPVQASPDEQLPAPTITAPQQGAVIPNGQYKVEGNALANSQVILYDDQTIIGSSFANSFGRWQIEVPFSRPKYQLKAQICQQQNCSDFSNVVAVTVTANLISDEPLFRLGSYRYFSLHATEEMTLDIQLLSGAVPYTVKVDWGDTNGEMLSSVDKSKITLTHKYNSDGAFNGSVIVEDATGRSEVQYFSVQVLEMPQKGYIRKLVSNWTSVVTGAGLATGGILSYGSFVHTRYVLKPTHSRLKGKL